jgi:hypothetical protein
MVKKRRYSLKKAVAHCNLDEKLGLRQMNLKIVYTV